MTNEKVFSQIFGTCFCEMEKLIKICYTHSILRICNIFPNRQWRTSISISCYIPVWRRCQSINKSIFYTCRSEIDLLCIRSSLGIHLLFLDKSAWHCLVNKRSLTSSTMRIRVIDWLSLHQFSCRFKLLNNRLIWVHHFHTCKVWYKICKSSVLIYWHKDPIPCKFSTKFFCNCSKIYLSKTWSDMHNSCSVFGSYKIPRKKLKKLILILSIDLRILNIREKRLISQIFKLFSFLTIDETILIWRFKIFFQKFFCHHKILLRSRIINGNIINILSYCQIYITW